MSALGFRGSSSAIAPAKFLLPKSSSHQLTPGRCGNRKTAHRSPQRYIEGGISKEEVSRENPVPSALITASFNVHNLKNIHVLRTPPAAASASCSRGAKTFLMGPSGLWRRLRSSTSTPRRPEGTNATRPWLPPWLTLKLARTGSSPTNAPGFPCSKATKRRCWFAQPSRSQRTRRNAARHKANCRRGRGCRKRCHRSSSSSSRDFSASASRLGSGLRST